MKVVGNWLREKGVGFSVLTMSTVSCAGEAPVWEGFMHLLPPPECPRVPKAPPVFWPLVMDDKVWKRPELWVDLGTASVTGALTGPLITQGVVV